MSVECDKCGEHCLDCIDSDCSKKKTMRAYTKNRVKRIDVMGKYEYMVCKKCDIRGEYSDRYDDYYCKGCDIWIGKGCTDETCYYCRDKPLKPSDVQ